MKIAIKPIVPLFSEPNENADLTDELLYGMCAEVIGEDNGFWQIKTYYGYTGYVHPEDLIEKSECWNPEYLVTSSTLDIMPTPKYRRQPILTLPRGSMIQVDSTVENGNYIGVILADGTTGFCVKYHVRKRLPENYWKTHESEIRTALVQTAMQYMEAPYRWGGKSPYGIDCSGLCSAVYLQYEILIWRDAELKAPLYPVKDRADLKPGDLIFFPGHVAMYIGQNRYIHSNQRHSGVCINSFDAHQPDYNENLLNTIQGMGTLWFDI